MEQAQAQLAQAKVNLARTELKAPVSGWVTNLQVQLGDYATVGERDISVVDAGSFWVDGYFEETDLSGIHEGDRARVKLIGWRDVIDGHVQGVARGIAVANAAPSANGLASVNPIFTLGEAGTTRSGADCDRSCPAEHAAGGGANGERGNRPLAL